MAWGLTAPGKKLTRGRGARGALGRNVRERACGARGHIAARAPVSVTRSGVSCVTSDLR
jgi:hypothetical protein